MSTADQRATPPPHILWRIAGAVGLVLFVSMANNPLVRLQAWLGLSPSPMETIFALKCPFCGMTEGVYQTLQLNVVEAFSANIFSPFVIPVAVVALLTWRFPKITGKRQELRFFLGLAVATILVNLTS